ncbi:shikimate dehydrogenase [soil metagenome]
MLLIGHDIAYSASPAMQAAAFGALGLDDRYELADIPAGELATTVARLRRPDLLGANATVPHKAAVMLHLDEIDAVSRRAGAVNTIRRRGGRLIGSNTDIPAIAEQAAALRPTPQHALILGAGGAARAVQAALADMGAQRVTLIARSGGAGAEPWSRLSELAAGADLLVNATPVGTAADESPVPAEFLHAGLAVLDLVYRPSPTRLVREARAASAAARAGAGVLLGQGWRSLAAWLDRPIPADVVEAMAGALRAELGHGADA